MAQPCLCAGWFCSVVWTVLLHLVAIWSSCAVGVSGQPLSSLLRQWRTCCRHLKVWAGFGDLRLVALFSIPSSVCRIVLPQLLYQEPWLVMWHWRPWSCSTGKGSCCRLSVCCLSRNILLLHLVIWDAVWLSHFRSSWMMHPRYLYSFTISIALIMSQLWL